MKSESESSPGSWSRCWRSAMVLYDLWTASIVNNHACEAEEGNESLRFSVHKQKGKKVERKVEEGGNNPPLCCADVIAGCLEHRPYLRTNPSCHRLGFFGVFRSAESSGRCVNDLRSATAIAKEWKEGSVVRSVSAV